MADKFTALVLLSGGMDSAVLAHHLSKERGFDLEFLSVNYGQRHQKELDYAAETAGSFGKEIYQVDVPFLAQFSHTSLTGGGPVPHGHYAEANMIQTVVPFRNPFFLSLAMMIAAGKEMDFLAIAVHAGDHFVYPDCRPKFIEKFRKMSVEALEGLHTPRISTPFIQKTKAEIAMLGGELGVDFSKTWSCYEGGDMHCGRCGTCVERLEALSLAGVEDTTEYADPDYWKGAIASHV